MKEKFLYFLRADSGQNFLPEVKSSKIFCELGSQVRELYAPLIKHACDEGPPWPDCVCEVLHIISSVFGRDIVLEIIREAESKLNNLTTNYPRIMFLS